MVIQQGSSANHHFHLRRHVLVHAGLCTVLGIVTRPGSGFLPGLLLWPGFQGSLDSAAVGLLCASVPSAVKQRQTPTLDF